MKRHMFWSHLLYYALAICAYAGFIAFTAWINTLCGGADNLGAIILVTYAFLFVGTPILIALLMRLSLLKWYVDPFAAAIIPLMLYFGMLFPRSHRYDSTFAQEFHHVNRSLSADGGEGWAVLLGLFLFGLVCSISIDRKNGQSFSYKLLAKFSHKSPTT